MNTFHQKFPTLLGLSGTHEVLGLAGITQSDKTNYVNANYPAAEQAGKKYNINPVVILAQGAMESGWGTSYMAKNIFNFFGVTAFGNKNEFWDGDFYVSKTSGLKFRKYKSLIDGFSDFARLISSKYLAAAKASFSIADYAREISLSPYAEQDPVNREIYRKGIISNAAFILKTKGQQAQSDKLTAELKNSPAVNPGTDSGNNSKNQNPESSQKQTEESSHAGLFIGLAAAALLFVGISQSQKH